ncbi:MAG: hypothetical protein ACI9MC_001150 [Kiritimatiellia bacterium]|jgi:hypothetical protein
MSWTRTLLTCALLCAPTLASADPCGMVPPIRLPDDINPTTAIQRTGVQTTYVSHMNGVETMVLRPGFTGKVDEFGMLIPFPSAPSIRKTADNMFQHIAAAVDPPRITIDIGQWDLEDFDRSADAPTAMMASETKKASGLRFNQVKVLNQEAVGMYEVAVLQAGSSVALDRWMAEHGFKYPQGMDDVVDDYVAASWVFVAIKTKVGQMPGVTPRPGLQSVQHGLPAGSSFDGHVQGMGFRFKSAELVVPMRLSTFNGPDTHNLVYVLTDRSVKVAGVPSDIVRRQVSGAVLHSNITDSLQLNVVGGSLRDVSPDWLKGVDPQRAPDRFNGLAKDLFGGDLMALSNGELSLPYEQTEKDLLNISEELGLRDTAVDGMMASKVRTERDAASKMALGDLRGLTLTVIDGDFPRARLQEDNITFASWEMPSSKNNNSSYEARLSGPGPLQAAPYLYGQRR